MVAGVTTATVNKMTNTLRVRPGGTVSLIPDSQPYSTYPTTHPLYYAGTESLPTTGTIPTDIVDWVILELRQDNNLTDTTLSTLVAKKAGILKTDGSIVSPTDFTSPISFDSTVTNGDYYVVVRHRNHLAATTATPITLSTTAPVIVDFTNPTTTIPTALFQTTSTSGVYAMRRANVSGDTAVNATDRTILLSTPDQANTYKGTDINMDGSINATDRTILLSTPDSAEFRK